MKKIFLLLLLASSGFLSAQNSLNDYEYVIVPIKFDILSGENTYRLSTITKRNLIAAGFKVFYSNEQLPREFANDRCNLLYADLEKISSLLQTKLVLVLKDCQNNYIFKSEEGKSREKELAVAFPQALEKTFPSLQAKNYAYNGKVLTTTVAKESAVSRESASAPVSKPEPKAEAFEKIESDETLFAQPIANGYQLVDTTPKVVLKIYKTSQPDYFTAQGNGINGALIKKGNEWFLEYYKNDQLVSEKLAIKF